MERMTFRRKLFGYSLEDLSKLLADRDHMFAEANRRAQAAEEQLSDATAKSGEKDRQIAALTEQIDEMSRRLEAFTDQSSELDELRRQVLDLRSDPLTQVVAGDIIVKFLIAEVAPVLKAAEESAVMMLEDAGVESRNRLERAEQARQEVRKQVDWLISWRERIDPLIRGVQERIGETRRRIEEIPDRIREALLPVTDSMTTANAELGELVRAAVPPPLLAQAEAAVAPEEDALYVDVPGTTDWPSDHGVEENAFPEPAWWGM
jgi:chromosome segregation ATPase